jgi:hypothetical protein
MRIIARAQDDELFLIRIRGEGNEAVDRILDTYMGILWPECPESSLRTSEFFHWENFKSSQQDLEKLLVGIKPVNRFSLDPY